MKNKNIINIIKNKNFTFSVEIVPPRNGSDVNSLLKKVKTLKGVINFISVTKGAGGSLRGGSLPICYKIQADYGIPSLAHFVARERTVSEIENDLTDLQLFGINNILALRGDAPAGTNDKIWTGDYKYAYQLCSQISKMNKGKYLPIIGSKNKFRKVKKANFSIFVAGHPENKLSTEIKHIKEKVKDGAQAIITQMFFSASKFEEYFKALRKAGINVPIIAGIRPLVKYDQAVSCEKFFGVSVPDVLKKGLNVKDDVRATKFGLIFTCELIDSIRRIGGNGVHLFTLDDVRLAKRIVKKTC